MDAPSFDDLAPEESTLFHGSTLDLSGASEFYKKRSRIASQLREHIKQVGANEYDLSLEILRCLLAFRRVGVDQEKLLPANRLARALFDCAKSLAFQLRLQMEPTKGQAWEEYFDAVGRHGPVRLRAKQRLLSLPVTIDGKVLESFSHPDLPQLQIQFAFNTELASFSLGEGPRGSAQIPESIESDTSAEKSYEEIVVDRLPELMIKIEGAPVTKMMIATFDRSGADIDLARAYTVKVLNGVMHELKRFLGMVSKRGRPRLGIGEKAALLLDHHRKNIVQVVAELCPSRGEPGHRHGQRCRDRVRLAADQYYKSLEREFLRYLPGEARKT